MNYIFVFPLIAVVMSLVSIGFAISAIRLTWKAERHGAEAQYWLGEMNRHLAEMREIRNVE